MITDWKIKETDICTQCNEGKAVVRNWYPEQIYGVDKIEMLCRLCQMNNHEKYICDYNESLWQRGSQCLCASRECEQWREQRKKGIIPQPKVWTRAEVEEHDRKQDEYRKKIESGEITLPPIKFKKEPRILNDKWLHNLKASE